MTIKQAQKTALAEHGFRNWEEALANPDAGQIQAINEKALLLYGKANWDGASSTLLEDLGDTFETLAAREPNQEICQSMKMMGKQIKNYPYTEFQYE